MSYFDDFVKHSLRVTRAAHGEGSLAERKLIKMFKKILKEIDKEEITAVRRNELLTIITNILQDIYRTSQEASASLAAEMVGKEELFFSGVVTEHSAGAIAIAPITKAQSTWITRNFKMQGRTFDEWFRLEGLNATTKVRGAIESGYIEGKTTRQIVKEVEAIGKRSGKNVNTLVRTQVMAVSQETRKAQIEENDDIVSYQMWESMLDNRTTPHICGVRDNKRYTTGANPQPIDHNLEWGSGPGVIHFNCRSQRIPVVEGVDFGEVDRVAVGAGENYEKGDKTTRTGRVRQQGRDSFKKGIYEVEQVSGRTRYETWLRRQPRDFIRDAIPNQKAAERFIGGESLENLSLRNAIGRSITVNDL